MIKETKNKIILEIKKSAEKFEIDFEFVYKTYFYLSKGGKKILFTESMPETTSALSYRITENKFLTNKFLKKNSFPMQAMEQYSDMDHAVKFLSKHKKIVIKPAQGIHGKGITVGIEDSKQLSEAINFAQKNDPYGKVLLEAFCDGDDFRVLVIGRKKVFVSKREPAFIIGNGKADIGNLIDLRNQKLIERYRIKKDDLVKKNLKELDYSFSSILEEKEKVYLKKTANIKGGGTASDFTDKISDTIRNAAIEISNNLKMDVLGIDVITEDISSDKFKVIEVNAYPGILLHIYPVYGKSYNVADEIVKYFFLKEEF